LFGLAPAYLSSYSTALRLGLMPRRRAGDPGSARWRPMPGIAFGRLRADVADRRWAVLLIHLPIAVLSASIGVWLFYVQAPV